MEDTRNSANALDRTRATGDDENDFDELRMPLTEHLVELRRRLLICIITYVACFLGSFGLLYRHLYRFIHWPLERANEWLPQASRIDTSLQALSPIEPILVAVKLSLIAALLFSSPMILYQIWAFVRPGLRRSERRAVRPVALAAPVCFIIGGSFGYLALLPVASFFFIKFAPMPEVVPRWTVDRTSTYVLAVAAATGVVFELPVAITLLSMLGIITPQFLSRVRKYVILVAFILAAVLTPPDPFSQLMLAIPIIVLYEISVLISKVVYRRRERRRAEQEGEQEWTEEP